MSNFNQFVSTIKSNGVAKASHFFCDIIPPQFMIQTASKVRDIIPFYVEGVNMPEISLSTAVVKDYGLNREVVVDKNYGTVTMNFMSDQNMTIKMFFDDWVRAAIMQKGGVFMYPESYTAETLSIYQVDQSKNVAYVIILNNVYPKIVDDVQLNSESRTLLNFRVQFTFESWDSYQFSTFDPSAPIAKDNSDNIRRAWRFIQLIRTGANKDGIKSAIINVGTRKIYDVLGKTGLDRRISNTIGDLLGKTGIGGALGAIESIFDWLWLTQIKYFDL